MSSLPKKESEGQTLLSLLVAAAIFVILIHALFTLTSSSYQLVSLNRSRITARHLAQEKLELIRNLPYNDIGTVGGIPAGIIEQQENVLRNGLNFLVETDIVYIDDPFDGLAPADLEPTDYKRARVAVSWEGLAASRKSPLVFLTDINPEEEEEEEGGTLSISVIDANGLPVSQATVQVVASTTSPPVDVTQVTGADGKISLPGSPTCISCYQITVAKTGYSSDRTYSVSEVANPIKPHASVLEGEVTLVIFEIDQLGKMDVSSVDSRENNFAPLGNVSFRLRGEKIIGTDTSGQPVYKYDQVSTTNASGTITISDLEWDSYHILMPSPTSYDISGTSPLPPLSLFPAGNLNFTFAVNTHSDHSLLTIVKDPAQNLIESAYVKIFEGAFQQEKTTGLSTDPDFGQAFFSGLEEKNYNLEATASGFLNFSGNVDVSGYTKDEIVMTPQ